MNKNKEIKENKSSQIANLKLYERKEFKKNLIIVGGVAGTISAMSLSLAVASRFFGVDTLINDSSFIANVINKFYQQLADPTMIGASIGGASGAALLLRHRLKKSEYFLENENDILAGTDEDITSSNAQDYSMRKLKQYAKRGRNK